MRLSVSGCGALAAVVVLTACSSSKVEDYRADANEICAAAHKRLGKHSRPSSPARLAEVTKREIAIRGDAIAELNELTVPMDLEGATVLVDDLETRQERARAIEKAAKAKDERKLRELEHEESEEFELEAQRAKDLGLSDCAEL